MENKNLENGTVALDDDALELISGGTDMVDNSGLPNEGFEYDMMQLENPQQQIRL